MDMQQYLEAIEWLRKETENVKSKLANLEHERETIAGETDQARNGLKAAQDCVSAVKREMAKAEQERSQVLQALEREKEELRRMIAEKNAFLDRKRGEKDGLIARLAETKKAMAPVISEMESLNVENAALEADIAELSRKLQESGGMKQRLDELMARWEAAMSLKVAFAKKGEFTRALLEENPELKSQETESMLGYFQSLEAELQETVFE